MDKLDQLASVLGVTVTQQVSQVKRPSPKGRPPKRKGNMETKVKTSKREFEGLGYRAAKSAFEDEFSTRRGVWFYKDWGVVVVFNNNPFNDPAIRKKELNALVKELKKLGIKTIARSQYGDTLEDGKEKYTQTLVLDCDNERIHDVINAVDEIGSRASWEAYHPIEPSK